VIRISKINPIHLEPLMPLYTIRAPLILITL
jgi:hypothetical protein